MDKARLIKLLNLTRSENDAEALSAIRMVNKQLKASNKSWEELFQDGPDPLKDLFKHMDDVSSDINDAFRYANQGRSQANARVRQAFEYLENNTTGIEHLLTKWKKELRSLGNLTRESERELWKWYDTARDMKGKR